MTSFLDRHVGPAVQALPFLAVGGFAVCICALLARRLLRFDTGLGRLH